MKQRNNCRISESGVSEIVGALILISMIVLVVAVIATGIISRPLPDKVPQVRFSVVNSTMMVGGVVQLPYSVSITHDGGDEISDGNYAVFIDDQNITDYKVYPDTNKKWSIGRTIVANSSVAPGYVRVYYTGSNSPTLLGQRTVDEIQETHTCTPPVAGFTFSQAASPPLTINFDGSTSTGTGTLSYQWNFGDGATGSGQYVSHPYATTGQYPVTLTVTDTCNTNSTVKQVMVSLPSCGTISGTKYSDLNGNGQRDPGEPGLAGWLINASEKQGNDWIFVKSTTTISDGTYLISGLNYQGASKFLIKETKQSGWRMTQPASEDDYINLLLNPNDCYKTGKDFGNQCTGFTVWAWVKWINKPSTPLSNQTFATIVVNGNTNFNRQYHLEHDQDNTKFEFNIATVTAGDQGKSVFSTTTPVNGTWYLVTGVYNQAMGTMAIYVNGSQEASRSADSSGLRAYPGNRQIGGPAGINWPNPPPAKQQRILNGSVFDVQYFDYVKSPADIQAHYDLQGHPA